MQACLIGIEPITSSFVERHSSVELQAVSEFCLRRGCFCHNLFLRQVAWLDSHQYMPDPYSGGLLIAHRPRITAATQPAFFVILWSVLKEITTEWIVPRSSLQLAQFSLTCSNPYHMDFCRRTRDFHKLKKTASLKSQGDTIWTCSLCVPNATPYQIRLHPG